MADHKRNLKRVLISLPAEDLDTLDNLGWAVVETGFRPNRSAAVRYLIEQSRHRPLPKPDFRKKSDPAP